MSVRASIEQLALSCKILCSALHETRAGVARLGAVGNRARGLALQSLKVEELEALKVDEMDNQKGQQQDVAANAFAANICMVS